MTLRTRRDTRRTDGAQNKAVWGIRGSCSVVRITLALWFLALAAAPLHAGSGSGSSGTLDPVLANLVSKATPGRSRVIVIVKPGVDAAADVRRLGGTLGRRLPLINGQVVELGNAFLRNLAESPAVQSIHVDRNLHAHLNRAAVT